MEATHALLTWHSYHLWHQQQSRNHNNAPGKNSTGPRLAPSLVRVHDFVRTSNGRPRSEACVFARPQPRELAVCALARPRRKTQYPHRDPGHFVPAVIKLNCYPSCGTSALAQPALPALPRHIPSLRADLS